MLETASPIIGREIAQEAGPNAGPTVAGRAIIIGALVSCAFTLFLFALGAGLGLSATSPWPGSGISGRAAAIATGIFLLMAAVLASTLGGYIAGHLRTAAPKLHTDEVYFRDTVNGLATWALATVLTVSVLAMGGMSALNAGVSSVARSAETSGAGPTDPAAMAAETLLRTKPSADGDGAKAEMGRIVAYAVTGNEITASDRAYADSVIQARSGVSREEADRRLNETVTEARAKADAARKAARNLALWTALSLLAGALAASFAAAEAGKMRDEGRHLGIRPTARVTTTRGRI
jgi:hypothetical protein